MDKDRYSASKHTSKHDILCTKVSTKKFDVKIYIQDKQHVGFWKAVNDDNWKTGCVVQDKIAGLNSIKVFTCVFITKYLINVIKYVSDLTCVI